MWRRGICIRASFRSALMCFHVSFLALSVLYAAAAIGAPCRAQLNLLVVLHRLAEESRVKAFEEKSATIKVHHVRAVAKKLLKSTRG
ncbi:hypothetical protein cypCar_00004495 [Cyprinus carpio]|nr:hypothetical protein cypCar_00004495 [Cyprinus carpio]